MSGEFMWSFSDLDLWPFMSAKFSEMYPDLYLFDFQYTHCFIPYNNILLIVFLGFYVHVSCNLLLSLSSPWYFFLFCWYVYSASYGSIVEYIYRLQCVAMFIHSCDSPYVPLLICSLFFCQYAVLSSSVNLSGSPCIKLSFICIIQP